jgi:hypothetical protein
MEIAWPVAATEMLKVTIADMLEFCDPAYTREFSCLTVSICGVL